MLYCDIITDAMIKGLGQQKASVRYNIITSILDLVSLYFLLPVYGISGYFFSFAITHAINFTLSLRRLLKISGVKIPFHVPALTLGCGLAAGYIAKYLMQPIMKAGAFLVIFISLLVIFKVINRADLSWLKGLIKIKQRQPTEAG